MSKRCGNAADKPFAKKVIAFRPGPDLPELILGWAERRNDDLYLSIGALYPHEHISFHASGEIWETSRLNGYQAEKVNASLPVANFKGWLQMQPAVFTREQLTGNPPVKEKHRRNGRYFPVELDRLPAMWLNIVVDIFHEDALPLRLQKELAAPRDAVEFILPFGKINVVTTILGHEHNLLVSANETHIKLNHINRRFTMNAPGQSYEAKALPSDPRSWDDKVADAASDPSLQRKVR